MRSLPRLTAVLTVAVLSLTACGSSGGGGSDSSSSSTPSAKPATGTTIKGTGYTFVAPEGWKTPPNGVPGFDFDSLAADYGDKDGFADNINVVRQDPSPVKAFTKATDKEIAKEIAGQNFKAVKIRARSDVDGDKAIHISSSQELNGKKNLAEQYYVIHDGALDVITFSYSTTVNESSRDEIAGSVLTTWKWIG